jgi:hypothetical protein
MVYLKNTEQNLTTLGRGATILNFRWAQKVTRPVKDLKMNIKSRFHTIASVVLEKRLLKN